MYLADWEIYLLCYFGLHLAAGDREISNNNSLSNLEVSARYKENLEAGSSGLEGSSMLFIKDPGLGLQTFYLFSIFKVTWANVVIKAAAILPVYQMQ